MAGEALPEMPEEEREQLTPAYRAIFRDMAEAG
jgi:hypothetical protein